MTAPRTLLWHVDHDATPPTMMVALVTRRRIRTVAFEIEQPGRTLQQTELAAVAQMKATHPAILDLLAS